MRKLLFISFILFCIIANAQTQYYYYKGQKINLTVDRNYVNVVADEDLLKSSVASQFFQKFDIEQNNDEHIRDMVRLKFKSTPDIQEYSRVVESLKQSESVKYVFPFFERSDIEPIGTSDVFYIKLKETKDTILLKRIAEIQNVQIIKQVPYMPLWYILSIQNSMFSNSVDASNYFYETGYFEDIDPAFMFNFKTNCTNDPMFNQLWGLKNTSNPNIDINACDAWIITRGAEVNVAVLDQGIDPNHNDLKSNFHSLSFDAQSGTSPSIFRGGAHGTHVAGTIAAIRNNSLQVVGVAPESKIMRVSHYMSISNTYSAEMASGISWAWQNGADIINNSWGDQGGQLYSQMHSAILENAIIAAITQGRGGKGCVIVFASGNWGVIDYPASFHNNILCVGAVDHLGIRSVFNQLQSSGYGIQLDVVAPGSAIYSTVPNNGVAQNGGTSMAAPHVAGIAALMLSANPNLTGQQVRDIIESTAQKVRTDLYAYSSNSSHPNGTWNNQVGHGLVDAYAAVNAAVDACDFLAMEITGPNPLSGDGIYKINNLPTNATVTWEPGPYIEKVGLIGPGISNTQADKSITIILPKLQQLLASTDKDDCSESWINAKVKYNGCEISLPRMDVRLGSIPDVTYISTIHNGKSIPSDNNLTKPLCGIFTDKITYHGRAVVLNGQNSYGLTGANWLVRYNTNEVLLRTPRPTYFSLTPIQELQINPSIPYGSTACIDVRLANNCGTSSYVPICYRKVRCNGGIRVLYSPNPTTNELTIEFEELPTMLSDDGLSTNTLSSTQNFSGQPATTSNQTETYSIKLLDASGAVLRQAQFNHSYGNSKPQPVKFNVVSLRRGTYFLHVEGGGELVREQIIVN